MLKTITQYGTFTLLGAAIILMLSFVVEKGIEQVDEMLVPCQHGTPFVQGKCRCDGTPFNGTYCSNCMCEHGVCSTEPTTPFSNSDYGCRCPTQSKRFGFLCDQCNTIDNINGTCKGECKPEFFGAKCERICYANLPYDNDNEVCNTMRSSGGQCNACNGHGTCQDGFCECDVNWFDDGRDHCAKTCPGTPICSGHGTCKLYGDTPGCLCERGWNGPKCDIPCPGMLETGIPCNNNGICEVDYDTNTATCDCLEKFRGEDCSIECPGDVVACNGHGTCDDLGVCTCQTNVKWSLPSCKCSDELTCNAKGTCNSNEQCECFGNNGGQHCLECKRNWHGENCDLYCDPYLKKNESDQSDLFGCYGHGTCLERGGSMHCTCNLDTTATINVDGAVNNYVSYYEAEMNCGECQEEYFPKQWVVNAYGLPEEYTVPCEASCTPATCNGHGVCNHHYGVPGESLCSCDIEHLDDASFCTECEANWYPLDFGRTNYCNRFCIASGQLPAECDGTIDCVQCNGHGTCTDEGDCLCTDGYTGDECQIYCTAENGLVCGGHGVCESNEIQQLMEHEFRAEGGIPLFGCTCDPQDPVDADSRIDWDEKLALGLVNGTLDPPPNPEYYGETCDFHCILPPWKDADVCNGLGNCSVLPIRLEDSSTVSCRTDSDCDTLPLLQSLSADSTWTTKKGPFCHKKDNFDDCVRSTNDCYEILLKQRPKKMRSEECVTNSTCYQSIDEYNWHQYCLDVEAKRQPSLFEPCGSVASFCPMKPIPNECKAMLELTDGVNVSRKLNATYEYDKRRYPFAITEEYRIKEGVLEHDEVEAEFRDFLTKNDIPNIEMDNEFCFRIETRYPSIEKAYVNKQYLCNGQIVNTNENCSGVLENSENNFYYPFQVHCIDTITSYSSFEEAIEERGAECKLIESPVHHSVDEKDGREYIDALCNHIQSKFPSCEKPEPCDFNPCSDDSYTCVNDGNKAICTTTGDLNSTCLKGLSERLSYSSYSCEIDIGNDECPKNVTFDTNVAKHCLLYNPVVDHVEQIGNHETITFNGTSDYIHFKFKAEETASTGTRLEFGSSIIIYVRLGQLQLNEVENLQVCPISDPTCNDVWEYKANQWYHIELALNDTHVTMTRKDTMRSITKPLLSSETISQVITVPSSSIVEYKDIVSENSIPSPYSCTYETCDLDRSYRNICSDIIRNVHYPTLLEPSLNVLSVCTNLYDKTRMPKETLQLDFNVLSEMYALNWDKYCAFYDVLEVPDVVTSYKFLENYTKCVEFIDPLDGNKTCIVNALEYDWMTSCEQLEEALVPNSIKENCPNNCHNHLLSVDEDYCADRKELFLTNTVVQDTCPINWYNYCLDDSKGQLQGTCSAVECNCNSEEYEGIGGQSCEIHCPIGFDGSPCAEAQGMGTCVYTQSQKDQIESAPVDEFGNKVAFDQVWALEGECQCYLSEGTRNCDIECRGCNNETYGEVKNLVKNITDPKILIFSNDMIDHYVYNGETDPDIEVCVGANITFIRCTSLHPLRVVKESDCPECFTGSYSSLPNTSLVDWNDVNGTESFTYQFTESGLYHYLCTSHPNMVGNLHVNQCNEYTSNIGQIGMCDNARGSCQCLPPFTEVTYETREDWRGKNYTVVERQYNDGMLEGEDLYRVRMMQGTESFIRNELKQYVYGYRTEGQNTLSVPSTMCKELADDIPYLLWGGFTNLGSGCFRIANTVMFNEGEGPDCSTHAICIQYRPVNAYNGEESWETILERLENFPERYICMDKPCTKHDVSLMFNLAGTSSRYNFDCNKECPGTDDVTKIPCSGNGICGVNGQCICDAAKIIPAVEEEGLVDKTQFIPGIEIEQKISTVDKLDRTGYRGEDCSIMCKGYDPEEGDMTKVCNGHGKCDLAGECACDIGYIGDVCQFKCPFSNNVDNLCSGHGVCELAEIQVFDEIFLDSSKQCAISSTYDACEGYTIINDLGFLDISRITIKKEDILCASPTLEACRTWKEYQNLDYRNAVPFEIFNNSKPSGCILEGNVVLYNHRDTDVTCVSGCLCEGVDRVTGVCSLEEDRVVFHKLGGSEYLKADGKYNNGMVWTGVYQIGLPDESLTSEECQSISNETYTWNSVISDSTKPKSCFVDNGELFFNDDTTIATCVGFICIEKPMISAVLSGPDTYENIKNYCNSNDECAGFYGDPPDTEGTYFAIRKVGSTIISGRTESYRLVSLEASCGGKTEIGNIQLSTSQDIMVEECAKACRETENCFFFSVDNNKCYKHDSCAVISAGTSKIYELQSPEAGRPFFHFQKALPVMCMSEQGLNFDSKTQAPIIRSLDIYKAMCTDGLIMDTSTGKCVDIATHPMIDATFFFDKGSEFESSMDINCQITGNSTVVCAQCACFSDFIYGKWAGFECETCAQGNGKSQCREICPGFDGENLGSMCSGNGKCVFGSQVDPLTGERTFQEAQCICGQDEQYAVREPTMEIVGQYEDSGGLDNDGAINAYFYYTPVPYPETFTSKFEAQAKCNEFNDLDNVDRGGYCYGVYREYVNSQTLTTYLKLHMGNVGGSFYLYGKYWGKKAISGYAHFYQFKSLELYQGINGNPQIKYCSDIESIRSLGKDTCNHFSSESESCDKCADGWTGKNCRSVCQRCLLGGSCDESPSNVEGSACICPAGAGALWEHQCCPTGFRVDDMVQWQSKTQKQVDGIRLSLTYDSSTTNELDAAFYCKACPGITHLDWMKADSLYKVCSGPSRGTCETMVGRLGLMCNCKLNEVTKNRWQGRSCACDESIITPYSLDASIAESTDYGCAIPTSGSGMCPTDDSVQIYFNPPFIYGQDSIYINSFSYGEPFYGFIAGSVYAREMPECTPSSPCHTGEGPCNTDQDCAGTLKCFERTEADEKLSFNAEKISPTMNYCYHEEETMVGCHPTEYIAKGDSREYNTQFYWDIQSSSFKTPSLGSYIPYSKDGNLAFVIHQQAFECPAGRYGITIPRQITYEHAYNGYCGGVTQAGMYEGNGDNTGTIEDQLLRCFEACLNQNTPFSGTWSFRAKSFHMDHNNGRCWCNNLDSSCSKTSHSSYRLYNIIEEGEWQVCDKCQPGKYQDTTGNIGWVKVTSGSNVGKTISASECETYADWHGLTFYGPPYSNAVYPHGCFIHSSGVYYQETSRTTACSSSATCLQYGGKGDRHPNCKNCPAGKFGGPVGSWSPNLCQVCPAGTFQNAAGTGCENCPAGKYETGGICYQCPNGRYSPERTAVQCNPCPKGSDTNGQLGTAGTDSSVCRTCPAGKANNIAGADCLDCLAGYVQPNPGQFTCNLCGVQQWQNLNGQTTCKTCGVDSPYVGNYGHVGARDKCVYCGTGYAVPNSLSVIGVISSSDMVGACTPCDARYHQPYTTLQTKCYACAAGRYNADTAQATCKACDPGYYQSLTAQTSCKDCEKGDYQDQSGKSSCTPCAVGRYTDATTQTSCKYCAKGSAQPSVGQSSCTPCAQHYYADSTGMENCKGCPAGRNMPSSTTRPYDSLSKCIACSAGKYNIDAGDGCQQCPQGQFSNTAGHIGTDDQPCKNCPTGYYTTSVGRTSCTRGCSAVLPGNCWGSQCACYDNRGAGARDCTLFYNDNLYEWDSYDCSYYSIDDCSNCGGGYCSVPYVLDCNKCGESCSSCGSWYVWDCSNCGRYSYSCDPCYGCCDWLGLFCDCSCRTCYGCKSCSKTWSCCSTVCNWCDKWEFCGGIYCGDCTVPRSCSRKKHWFWADC